MSHKPRELSARQQAVLAEHAFKKGEVHNPGGRPKLARIADAYRRALAEPHPDGGTMLEAIARTMVKLAAGGNIDAVREVANRVDGLPRAEVKFDAPFGEGVFSLRSVSDAELDARLTRCNEILKRTAKVQ